MNGGISLTAGMRANLLSLQQTDSLLTRTQERLATGKKVNSALDNAQAYFSSRANYNRADALDGRKDAMGQAISTVEAANNGLEGINKLLDAAQAVITQAQSSLSDTSDDTKLKAQYDEIIAEINDLVSDSGYQGTNLLDSAQSITVAFNEKGDNTLTISGVSSDTTALGVTDTFAGATATALDNLTTQIATAKNTLESTATSLSSSLSIVEIRSEFTDNMINTLEEGADKLTLADTNEEGANMLALQTRQQLGITSLSLANQSAQAVLSLF